MYTITNCQQPVTVVTATCNCSVTWTICISEGMASSCRWEQKCSCMCSWFGNHTEAVHMTFPGPKFSMSWCLFDQITIMFLSHCSFLSTLNPNMGYKLFRDPVPTITTLPPTPPSPKLSGAFSVLLCLRWVVLPLAGVPEEQRDADGGQSHHAERSPVQLEKGDMGKWCWDTFCVYVLIITININSPIYL